MPFYQSRAALVDAYPPVAGRSCGDCRACCYTLAISADDLAKKAYDWCQHCASKSADNPNGGCTIYDRRPKTCAQWHCAWRRFGDLADDMRPDRSGLLGLIHDQPMAIQPNADPKPVALLLINTQEPWHCLAAGSAPLQAYGRLASSMKLLLAYRFDGERIVEIGEDGTPL